MESNPNNNQKLTLVLPCYNPPENWEKVVVDSVNSIQSHVGEEVALIIVNDGSTKNVEEDKKKYILNALPRVDFVDYKENRGKGYALRQGVAKVESGLIIYTDIDFPYEEESLLSLYKTLKEGHDAVLGHRGQEYYSKTPFFRKIISKTLRWILKVFLRLPTDDSQCGIKGFNSNGAKVFMDTRIDRFLFDLEFIKLCAKRKLDIKKAEVELKPNVIFSKVNFRILAAESLNFFKVLFRK